MLTLALLVSLLLEIAGGSPCHSISSITISGGECEECDVRSNVTKDQDREMNIEVTEPGTYIRIQTDLEEEDQGQQKEPVVFVLRTDSSVKTWRISGGGHGGRYSARLLPTSSKDSNMKLMVSTKSQVLQHYTVRLTVLSRHDVVLRQNHSNLVTISPTAQALFQYTYEDSDSDNFLLTVRSTQEFPVCSLVSVQRRDNETDLPLYDQPSDMTYGNGTVHQTMLNTTAIVIRRTDYPGGINIVLLAKPEDDDCYLKTSPPVNVSEDRSMRVEVAIQEMTEDPLISTGIVIGLYAATCLMVFLLQIVCSRCQNFEFFGRFGKQDERLSRRVPNRTLQMEQCEADQSGRDTPDAAADDLEEAEPHRFFWQKPLVTERVAEGNGDVPDGGRAYTEYDMELREIHRNQLNRMQSHEWFITRQGSANSEEGNDSMVEKYVMVNTANLKQKRANRENVTVADMAVFHHNPSYFPNYMRLRSEMFLYLILLAGIYYTLPVFQLVYYYQETAEISGNLDTCYYNYLCQYPYWVFNDYGHVFSNIGYVLLGLLFIVIVKIRSHSHSKLVHNELYTVEDLGRSHPLYVGIPESYGIFYAMGAALVLEGILSGCYHICPTAENFQFDTTFMYCISVLVFLKVYQFRHTDVTNMAHHVFLVIGVALILEVFGIFFSGWFFWTLFTVVYISLVIIFIIQIYFNWSGPNLRERAGILRDFLCSNPNPAARLVKVKIRSKVRLIWGTAIILLINIGMAIFFVYRRKPGVSRYILAIMMINMILYVTYYILEKLHLRLKRECWMPSEGIRKITLLYGLLSLLFMFGAVIFFIRELKTSAGTAAESRNLNAPCFLFIFDNHDMWHFLSASGLFYLFLFILTLEDYNSKQPRNKIPVF